MGHEQILKAVKRILKAKKLTYADLAIEIGMSESGLKKILTAKDISVGRLTDISVVLGISIAELFQIAQLEEIKTIRLSSRQENALFENHNLFRIFWFLAAEQRKPDEIRKSEKLSLDQWSRYVIKLENLDLVRIGNRGKIYPTHRGLFRWTSEGPLLKKVNKEWSENTLRKSLTEKVNEKSLHRLVYLTLSEKSKELFSSD